MVFCEYPPHPPSAPSRPYLKNWTRATIKASRFEYLVTARIAPNQAPLLSTYFGSEVDQQIKEALPDENGWITLTLPFEHFFAAREYILGQGCAIQVLCPEPLRLSVIDFAQQVLSNYPEA